MHTPGCTLEQYAKTKQIPIEFLNALGISEFKHSVFKTTVLRVPYRDADGAERAVSGHGRAPP